MKLVREHINEIFTDESDPIRDMGIGINKRIDEWIKAHLVIEKLGKYINQPPYIINNDATIDVYGSLYKIFEVQINGKFPDYIRFNVVHGFCDIAYTPLTSLKGFPRIVEGYFRCSDNKLTSLKYCPEKVYDNFYPGNNPGNFTKKDVRKYCKYIGGEIHIPG